MGLVEIITFGCLLFVHTSYAETCRDRRPDCATIKSVGYCEIPVHREWVTTWCKRTCKMCGVVLTDPPVVVTPKPPTVTRPTNLPPAPTGCGKSSFQKGKVIAGETAIKGAWPWQVMLKKRGKKHCGGTLISPDWVLTAAHCIDGSTTYQQVSIVIGEHNALVREFTETEIPASKIITHPSWNRGRLTHDIGLVKLRVPAKFDNFVQPACLPKNPPKPGTQCYITGWGKTTHPGKSTHLLQQGTLKVVSKDTCSKLNPKELKVPVTDAMLCAGSGGSSRLSGCHGDSGGPFVCKDGNSWYVHGAVSHGSRDCNSSKAYTVFSRVTFFRDWIRKHANL